jgi:hypothetical protein
MIAEDPFHIHSRVRFDVQAINSAIRAENFLAQWAVDANPISLA